jgi:hypothetical protein
MEKETYKSIQKKNENKNKASAFWYHIIRFSKIEAAAEVNDKVTRFSFNFPNYVCVFVCMCVSIMLSCL